MGRGEAKLVRGGSIEKLVTSTVALPPLPTAGPQAGGQRLPVTQEPGPGVPPPWERFPAELQSPSPPARTLSGLCLHPFLLFPVPAPRRATQPCRALRDQRVRGIRGLRLPPQDTQIPLTDPLRPYPVSSALIGLISSVQKPQRSPQSILAPGPCPTQLFVIPPPPRLGDGLGDVETH